MREGWSGSKPFEIVFVQIYLYFLLAFQLQFAYMGVQAGNNLSPGLLKL